MATAERRRELLVKTFTKRREWVMSANGPDIAAFFAKYPVFITHPEEVSIIDRKILSLTFV